MKTLKKLLKVYNNKKKTLSYGQRKTVKGQNKTNIKTRFCCKEKKIIFQKLFSGLESDFLSSAFDLNETKKLKN